MKTILRFIMAAFSLVNYSDDSDAEEDSGCDINQDIKALSTKRNIDDVEELSAKRQKENGSNVGVLPSVPSDILNMFKDTSDKTTPKEDPSRHQGRIRSFQHEAGNWASLVYIPLEKSEELEDFITSVIEKLRSFGDFETTNDFHISLSRTFVLRHHWIDSFIGSLRKAMQSINRLTLNLSAVEFYTNDEKSRTFVGLRTYSAVKQLEDIVLKIDDCLGEFRLPRYYTDPSFHVSICWALGDVKSAIPSDVLTELQNMFDSFMVENPHLQVLSVSELVCKTGNKYFNVPLMLRS